jgi:hypothetical protein
MAKDQETPPIGVEKDWFEKNWKISDQLLDCFRESGEKRQDHEDLLHKILDSIKGRYAIQNDRKLWRADRMIAYNNLLVLALGAENQEWQSWTGTKWDAITLEPGSIYRFILDYIHEHDDIMFKYYAEKDSRVIWREKLNAFFLAESMEIFRKYLVNPIIEILMPWDEGKKEDCKELLARAKEEFKKRVSSAERTWKYKARIYWLLARAKHAMFFQGRQVRFKSFDYNGPIGTLFQEIVTEDNEMLLEKELSSANGLRESISLFQFPKMKFADKKKKDLQLGILKYPSLLAYASAANDLVLVLCILKSKEEHIKSPEWNYIWEEDWKKTWANALWHAAYKGHGRIVKELLKCSEIYSAKHYSENSMQPPLHVAVRRGHISVVDAFCSAETKSDFSCHEEDQDLHQTPLEAATYLKDKPTKKKIQSTLLQRAEVKQAVEESYRQRELTVGSANAIMVGAALIAGITYAGWLQPPLGYHNYYQFTEPVPGGPEAPLSYMFVQGHMAIRLFAIFNSLSFFFAIAAIVAGMETYCYIGDLEETYITKTVEKLRYQLKRTRISFIASVIFVLIAFSSAAIAILPPINLYQRDIYITIGLGGFVCLVFIGRTLLSISKRRFYKRTRSQLVCMLTNIKEKFWNTLTPFVPSLCCKGLKKIKYYLEEGN